MAFVFILMTQTGHNIDVIMGAMASQITGVSIVYSTVTSGGYKRKHQSSAFLAFVRGIHWWPVISPHKGPVTRKMFPFDDVIMIQTCACHDESVGVSSAKVWHDHITDFFLPNFDKEPMNVLKNELITYCDNSSHFKIYHCDRQLDILGYVNSSRRQKKLMLEKYDNELRSRLCFISCLRPDHQWSIAIFNSFI